MRNKPYPYYPIADVRTLRDLLIYGREHGKDHTIFYTGKQNDRPMSFRSAFAAVEAMGTFLLSEGYRGARIALLGENSTEWCLSYFAVTNSGNTVVPLDRELPKEELAELLRRCGCSALLYSDKYAAHAALFQSLPALPPLRCYPLSGFDGYVSRGEALLAGGDTAFADTVIEPDTLACIVYTSGTSGKSKGVMLSHGNLASDVVATCQCVTASNTQIFLPMNHTFSWASAMFAAFLYSVDAHISGNMKRIVKDLNRNKPQNISAVPVMVEMLYNGIWTGARSLRPSRSSARSTGSAGPSSSPGSATAKSRRFPSFSTTSCACASPRRWSGAWKTPRPRSISPRRSITCSPCAAISAVSTRART